MCSMALVHSRISKIYYVLDSEVGYLNTKCKIHCLSSLNHNFEVFKVTNVEAIDDTDIDHLKQKLTEY